MAVMKDVGVELLKSLAKKKFVYLISADTCLLFIYKTTCGWFVFLALQQLLCLPGAAIMRNQSCLINSSSLWS